MLVKPTEDDVLGATVKCCLTWAQSQNRHLLIDAVRGLKMNLGQGTTYQHNLRNTAIIATDLEGRCRVSRECEVITSTGNEGETVMVAD